MSRPTIATTDRAPWRWIAAAAVLVAAVIVLVVVTVVREPSADSAGVPTSARTPVEAVRMFLQALADGDGDRARSVIVPPPSRTFLGDDALSRQHAAAPITDIDVHAVGSATSAGDTASPQNSGTPAPDAARSLVGVSFRIGEHPVTTTFTVVDDGDRRLVADPVAAVPTGSGTIPGLTLLGVPVAANTAALVFPGRLVWGSTDPYLSVTPSDTSGPASTDVTGGSARVPTPELLVELSDTGIRAIQTAIADHLAACAGSVQADASADRPDCVQRLFRDARPGSVRWTAPAGLADLLHEVDQSQPARVSVFGSVEWLVTYLPASGGATVQTTVSQPMDGVVDLSARPTPIYAPRRP